MCRHSVIEVFIIKEIIMESKKESFKENNPETGIINVFRKEKEGQRPEEAGESHSGTAPGSDKENKGKMTEMERTALKEEQGFRTMDERESREGLGGRLPGDEPGA